ncbi:MAG: DUF935 family protein [Paludibacteraceae bacterium]|nr:DUF935 family protein [Paludibacteraceae bacterium]
MGLFGNFINLFQRSDGMSREMRRHLRSIDKEKARKMLVELNLQTERLTRQDIGAWRMAWQRALDVENPNRNRLYDIYTDVSCDLHLTGCIGQRKGFVTRKGFKLVDKDGMADEAATALFEQEWFDDFVSEVLDTRFWGASLIEFGAPVSVLGQMRFSSVSLVPRRHVRPEYGVIVRDQNDTPDQGISYREGSMADWCIEVGKPRDLGLLLKCCPQALPKKNMLAFWDGFGEIFGMPIRIARTTSADEKERSKLENMLEKMGTGFYGVFAEGTEIEIKETTRGDAYNVYDKRIERANSELSKGTLNQTMTIDSGSSLSQSEVHLEVFEDVVEQDRKFLRNVVNNRLIPFMIKHGFPLEGKTFGWDDTVEYTPEQIRQVEQMLIQGGYDIAPEYFKEKYDIDITGKRQPALPEPDGGSPDDEPDDLSPDDKKQLRRLADIITGGDPRFFG